MEITPNEMRNHQFGTSMRGYNKAEVDAFVQGTADALEEARAELQELKEEKSSLITKYEELRRIEDSIENIEFLVRRWRFFAPEQEEVFSTQFRGENPLDDVLEGVIETCRNAARDAPLTPQHMASINDSLAALEDANGRLQVLQSLDVVAWIV